MPETIDLSSGLTAVSLDDVTPEVVVPTENYRHRASNGSINRKDESVTSLKDRTKAKSAINVDKSVVMSANNYNGHDNWTTTAKINPVTSNCKSNTLRNMDGNIISKPATSCTTLNTSRISTSGDDNRTGNPAWSSPVPDLSPSQNNDVFDPQKTYYGRLCNLIICEGTKALQRYVKSNIDQRITLQDLLQIPKIQSKFCFLKKTHKILHHQYKILYPDDGSPLKEDNIDISLWVVLARNLVKDRDMIDWVRTPRPDEDLLPHHVVRYANETYCKPIYFSIHKI